jgi:hypothetical protein
MEKGLLLMFSRIVPCDDCPEEGSGSDASRSGRRPCFVSRQEFGSNWEEWFPDADNRPLYMRSEYKPPN